MKNNEMLVVNWASNGLGFLTIHMDQGLFYVNMIIGITTGALYLWDRFKKKK